MPKDRKRATSRTIRQYNRQLDVPLYIKGPIIDEETKKNIFKITSEMFKESLDKEAEIMNAIGPNSIPERHYEKSFKIKD